MVAPGLWKGEGFFAFVCFHPNAGHLRLYFAMTILPDATTWAVTQGFWTCHRACHARGVQHALPAHFAIPNWFLDPMFEKLNDGK